MILLAVSIGFLLLLVSSDEEWFTLALLLYIICMGVNVLVFSNTEYVRKMCSMVDQSKSTLVIFTHKKPIQFGTHQRHEFTS